MCKDIIKEFHLFAGIGGGIYGGTLLGHTCCGGVEIDTNCQKVLKQRQADGWMEMFPIYGDLTKLSGKQFKGTFDILCGGFPCLVTPPTERIYLKRTYGLKCIAL